MGVAPSRAVPLLIELDAGHSVPLAGTEPYLKFLARLESVRVLAPGEQPPPAAAAVLGKARLLIPMAGLIDLGAERQRLDREIEKTRANLQRSEQKLTTESFVSGAPAEVVAKERTRAAEMRAALEQLQAQRERLASVSG